MQVEIELAIASGLKKLKRHPHHHRLRTKERTFMQDLLGKETRQLPFAVPQTPPPRLLVLEDQPEIHSLVTAMLKIRGFACDTAGTLAEARALMAAAGLRYPFPRHESPRRLRALPGGGIADFSRLRSS